jgi:hypothetical protein
VIANGRWQYRDSQLVVNIAPAAPQISEPIVLMHESMLVAGDNPGNDPRAAAVGDFVVRLFALADPNDHNLEQTIRNFLDNEERDIDQKYADDPATAGMIRELIAARRKIFESDEAIGGAATAEAKADTIARFLQSVLTSADPAGGEVTPRAVLESAARSVEEHFADNPEVAATVRERLAEAQRSLPARKPAETAADQGEARQDDDQFPKVGLFRHVRWKDQWTPIVQLSEEWYELVTLDGIAARGMVEHARQRHGEEKARERFSEDLAQLLIEMNHQPGATCKLQLRDLKSGSVLAINEAPWTAENRESVLRANFSAEQAGHQFVEWTGSEG